MGKQRTLYVIAENCPFDAMLVKEMRRSVNSLLQLNLKRFRVPEKTTTRYSALDILKQALELMFEFSPSERNYREAMRTIQVYSEGDEEMLKILRASFKLTANAVYNAFSGQRYAETLKPTILFLQGIPFERTEFEQAFRFVGVRPPDISPSSVKAIVFLDEKFEPYKELLNGELVQEQVEKERSEHWANIIEDRLVNNAEKALIRVDSKCVDRRRTTLRGIMTRRHSSGSGKLRDLLQVRGITLEVIHHTEDINAVFGKK
jgi:hypothetical protein